MEESIKHKNISKVMKGIPRVENICGNSGREIANQFRISGENYTLFQSYKSPIAMIMDGKTYIFSDWAYSVTTGKYRNLFLGETKEETRAKLKSGEYVAVDFEIC